MKTAELLFLLVCAGWCGGGIVNVAIKEEPSLFWVLGIACGVGWLFATLKSINDRLLK